MQQLCCVMTLLSALWVCQMTSCSNWTGCSELLECACTGKSMQGTCLQGCQASAGSCAPAAPQQGQRCAARCVQPGGSQQAQASNTTCTNADVIRCCLRQALTQKMLSCGLLTTRRRSPALPAQAAEPSCMSIWPHTNPMQQQQQQRPIPAGCVCESNALTGAHR